MAPSHAVLGAGSVEDLMLKKCSSGVEVGVHLQECQCQFSILIDTTKQGEEKRAINGVVDMAVTRMRRVKC